MSRYNGGWKTRVFIHSNFERRSRHIAEHTCRTLNGDINFVVTECVFLPQRESGTFVPESLKFFHFIIVARFQSYFEAVFLFSLDCGPRVLCKTTRFKRRSWHANLFAIILKLYSGRKLYDIVLRTSNDISWQYTGQIQTILQSVIFWKHFDGKNFPPYMLHVLLKCFR